MAKALATKVKKPLTDSQRRAKLLKAGRKNPKGLMLMPPRGMKDEAMAYAADVIDGTTDNAMTVWSWGKQTRTNDLHITHCVVALQDEVAKVQSGDLSQVDAMLFGQAKALSAVFHTCMAKASANLGQHLGATETYMRLALKAQSQCRTTLETLVETKQPRSVAFVRQANIANGHQQVNNNGDARGQTGSQPNELQGEFSVVDSGTQAASLGVDAPASAMAQVHRPANVGRKAKIQPKRIQRRGQAHAAGTRKRA